MNFIVEGQFVGKQRPRVRQIWKCIYTRQNKELRETNKNRIFKKLWRKENTRANTYWNNSLLQDTKKLEQ